MTRKLRISLVVIGLFCMLHPAFLLAEDPITNAAQGTSRILGQVTFADADVPLSGVKVLAYNLSTEKVFSSQLTPGDARYEIRNLPHGYYDLAVETAAGVFVANQVVNVAPGGKAKVDLQVRTTGGEVRDYAGTEQPTAGVATVAQKAAVGFWNSPRGVAIIAGTGGAALLAIGNGGGGDPAPSPPSPSDP